MKEVLPPGMKAVGGVGNGIFELVQDLVGYMDLCFLSADDPELYADLFTRVGRMSLTIWEVVAKSKGHGGFAFGSGNSIPPTFP